MGLFTFLFVLIAGSLFVLELMEPVRQAVVLPFTSVIADVCSWLVQLFDGDAIAVGDQIRSQSSGHAIQIAPGCNGIEAMIILFAAIVAFPKVSFWYRIKGLFWGFLAIQALNVVRIISLFYLLQWDRDWFDWFHFYLWQALIMLDALVVWLVWLKHIPRKDSNTPATEESHAAESDQLSNPV